MSTIDTATTQSLFELYRAGEFESLAEQVRDLLRLHPEQLVLHSLLGAACLELGDHGAAVESYRAALAIRPRFAKAHNSLGIAYLRSGRLEDAAGSFLEAIDCDPRFAEPRFNLGLVGENRRLLSEAAEQYEQAVRLEPGYGKAWCALAKVSWELGNYGRVVDCYGRALGIDARDAAAHRGLMQFLEQSNRHGELREAVARARKALGAEHPLVRFQEGVIADIDGDSRSAKALLESCGVEPVDALTLHDERMRMARLTAICDRLDDIGGAMEYAAGANRLSRQSSAAKGVDKTRFLGFIENRTGYFTEPNVRQWRRHEEPGSADSSQQPVFVVGFPRSGTTLMDTVLRGHPGIEVAEESDAVPTMVNGLCGPYDEYLADLGGLSSDAIERARSVYFEALARHVAASDKTPRLVDRFALNSVYAGEIHRVFPDARFILMLRHPADCVLSCYLRTFVESSANDSFHSLEEAAHLYDRVMRLWTQLTEVLDLELIAVRYEDLVADVERTCRPVLEFIGVPWHPGVLDHEATARSRPYIRTASYNQVTQPLYARSTGRWLKYREHMEPTLPVLAPWMERFGYGRESTSPD